MTTSIRVRRGNRANLPASAPSGMLLWCEDTKELFIGTGDSVIKPFTGETGIQISNVYNLLCRSLSLNGNGYIGIPLNDSLNLYIQWGSVSGFGYGTSADVYFPKVFPNACVAVTVSASYLQGAGNKGSTAQVYRVATNRFHITSKFEQGAAGLDWIAIGW